jgi:hypothetical protein
MEIFHKEPNVQFQPINGMACEFSFVRVDWESILHNGSKFTPSKKLFGQ